MKTSGFSQRGSALIVIVLSIALLAVLVVGYLSSTRTAISTSSAYAARSAARQAADSAEALAISQIKAGTSGGTTVAWASQPGAIRTYDSAGGAKEVFKLYSAARMVASGSDFDPAADWAPSGWTASPGLYVDLNEPVQGAYPIINPAAAAKTGGQSLVDGFSIDATATPLSGATNPAALPVRWIYQLRDGTLTVPTTSTGSKTVIPGASPENPPVARFAFWTDDESCKLNINTASEGSYWDVPMAAAPAELYFARYQPARREYQRYPGHPATTSLSPVFWNFLGLDNPSTALVPVLNPARNGAYYSTKKDAAPALSSQATAYFDALFKISPRLVLGGSRMGGVATVTSGSIAIGSVDDDRLYASVDELLFARSGSSATARTANTPLTQDMLEKVRFFLTASSRAPEVNLFNQPKITMWPIDDPSKSNPGNPYNSAPDSRSPLDKLIAFCSTLDGNAYYFTRANPTSTAGDFAGRNEELYNYLARRLGDPIPGFGASFASRYGQAGDEQILTLIYDYIRSNINLADSSSATSGATPSALMQYAFAPGKSDGLSTGRGQVVPFRHPGNGTKGIGRFPTVRQCVLWFSARAANQPPVMVNSNLQPVDASNAVITSSAQVPVINPMHPWTGPAGAPVATGTVTNQYPTLGSGTNQQTHAGLPYLTITGSTGRYDQSNPRYPASLPALGAHQTLMQAVFTFEMVNSSVGNLGMNPAYRVRVRGLSGFQADGVSLGMTADATETAVTPGSIVYNIQYSQGLPISYRRITGAADGVRGNPLLTFAGTPLVVNGATFTFGGGQVDLDIIDPDGEVVQTLKVDFPSATFPTPMLPARMPDYFLTDGATATSANYPPAAIADLMPSTLLTVDSGTGDPLALNPNAGTGGTYYIPNLSRLVFANTGTSRKPDPNAGPGKNLFLPQIGADPANDSSGLSKFTCDTIRSVECKYGDTRLIAALASVPSGFFAPHKDYYDPSIRPAYSFAARGGTVQPLTDAPANQPSDNYYATNWGRPTLGTEAMRNRLAARMDGTFPQASLFPYTTSSTDFTDGNFRAVWAAGGDFDTGLAVHADGPFINKPEEGSVLVNPADTNWPNPYFDSYATAFSYIGSTLFSPNRQVPSPVILGSLPAGLTASDTSPNTAWRTLLFSPNPNSKTHAALGANPPDYALLDFFHMPVVEPYAISEPLSTAGKVNLNYQIVPFTYVHRDTALRGVLKAVDITAIPDKLRYTYKSQFAGVNKGDYFGDQNGPLDQASAAAGFWDSRYPIHAGETLKQFDARFAAGNLFRSASEICGLWLYPATQPTASSPNAAATPLVTYDAQAAAIKSWWYDNAGDSRKSLTGDNLRERPYALLYPRVTTKSNSFTVHVRSQALKGVVAADGTIDDAKNLVAGEWRGSFLIERYIDPNDPALPDFAASSANSAAVDGFYRFRTVATKQFGQ